MIQTDRKKINKDGIFFILKMRENLVHFFSC